MLPFNSAFRPVWPGRFRGEV